MRKQLVAAHGVEGERARDEARRLALALVGEGVDHVRRPTVPRLPGPFRRILQVLQHQASPPVDRPFAAPVFLCITIYEGRYIRGLDSVQRKLQARLPWADRRYPAGGGTPWKVGQVHPRG